MWEASSRIITSIIPNNNNIWCQVQEKQDLIAFMTNDFIMICWGLLPVACQELGKGRMAVLRSDNAESGKFFGFG